MNLCSDKHDEVCYEGRHCPVCELREEKDDELEAANTEIKHLKEDIAILDQEVAELKEPLVAEAKAHIEAYVNR